jgi:hypothetical protein
MISGSAEDFSTSLTLASERRYRGRGCSYAFEVKHGVGPLLRINQAQAYTRRANSIHAVATRNFGVRDAKVTTVRHGVGQDKKKGNVEVFHHRSKLANS